MYIYIYYWIQQKSGGIFNIGLHECLSCLKIPVGSLSCLQAYHNTVTLSMFMPLKHWSIVNTKNMNKFFVTYIRHAVQFKAVNQTNIKEITLLPQYISD